MSLVGLLKRPSQDSTKKLLTRSCQQDSRYSIQQKSFRFLIEEEEDWESDSLPDEDLPLDLYLTFSRHGADLSLPPPFRLDPMNITDGIITDPTIGILGEYDADWITGKNPKSVSSGLKPGEVSDIHATTFSLNRGAFSRRGGVD